MGIKIGIINPNGLESSLQTALDALVSAFANQNIKVHLCLYSEQIPKADLLIGTYEKSLILKELVETEQVPLDLSPEAIIIKELTLDDHTALWACAYDSRGLLYVLYELAERINAQSIPALYKPAVEKPAFKSRSVLHFLPFEAIKKGEAFPRSYWRSYFEMLIQNRFNGFTLVLPSPSGAPIFPYLFSVPEYPEVKPFHFPEDLRATNLKTLKEFATLTAESGLDFQLGFWDFYAGQLRPAFQVQGLNGDNLGSYLYLALKQILFACPEISGLEFKFQSLPLMPDFCLNTLIQAVLDTGNKTSLNFYTDQMTPEIVDLLNINEIKAQLTKESWGGKLGLPYLPEDGESSGFQLTTSTVFPWGDPDYLYRLLPLLKSTGYDRLSLILPDLDTQGEYERHWYQFHLYGRLTYHPGTTPDVLIRDFHRRFGKSGNELADLYHLRSKVIPLYNWVQAGQGTRQKLNTGGLLPFYLRTPSCDPTYFADCREYVQATLNRTELPKVTPPAVADQFHQCGTEILQRVQQLQEETSRSDQFFELEWEQTLTEAENLGHFALFHSAKLRAATELAFFMETKDLFCLEQALSYLKKARLYWEKLDFVHRFEGRLLILEDEKRLQILLDEYRTRDPFLIGFDFGTVPTSLPHNKAKSDIFPDYYIEEGFTFVDHLITYNPDIGYGWLNTTELKATPAPPVRLSEDDLLPTPAADTAALLPYENQLLNKMVWSRKPASFQVDLTPGFYQAKLTLCDRSPQARRHGPMSISINEQVITEELIVPPGKRLDLQVTVETRDGKLNFNFSCPPNQDWFISALTIHPVVPLITHTPVTTWVREKPLAIRATVTGVNPIGQVILYYQSENERGYHMLMMNSTVANTYVATIPTAYLEQGRMINYYITALDNQGKEGSLGSFETPLTVTVLKAGDYIPAFFHFTPNLKAEDDSVTLQCTIHPTAEVDTVTLYYRNNWENRINQVRLEREHADDPYRTILSGSQVLPDCALQYRFVVKFKNGVLELFPNPLTSTPYFEIKRRQD
ncbi:MAG TPA: hypothetical protein DD789_03485 [Firmicutes bacterium]|nr:hypothetical protein [Bacillota bacterium]